jgi:microcystin-dependent protein
MSDSFLGSIQLFGFNFAPTGWALCNGQTLAIQQYTALFSLLGTTYGGNGTTNFVLPNLQGEVAIGMGQGAGLSDYVIGETGGEAGVTLTAGQMPAHTHPLHATTATGTATTPAGNLSGSVLHQVGRVIEKGTIYTTAAPNTALTPASVAPAGGGKPHNNLQPYLTLNYCIALAGIFPPRS